MRSLSKLLLLTSLLLMTACASDPKPSTPLETLKAYGSAYKKKDITTMKLLLSQGSIKMAEQEAKSQGVTLDEIVKDEKLFNNDQTTAEFRNAKIEDDKATIEMKDSRAIWNTVYFVKEDGVWKIDKQGFANQILQQEEESKRKSDDLINSGRIP